jgi:hypothetical protein
MNTNRFSIFILISIIYLVVNSREIFAQSSVVAGSIATSKTAYTVGSGNNRLIVVAVSDESAGTVGTVSSISWGGQALTLARGQTSGLPLRGEIWYLNEAGISAARGSCSYNFVVTWSTGPTAEVFSVFTLKDVDQTSPVSAVNSTQNNPTVSLALPSVAVVADDIVIYASISAANKTHTPSVGYTELSDQAIGATTALAVASKQIVSSGNETPSATWSGGANRVIIVGVVFNGVTATSVQTFYSLATGAWDLNTSWSFSADGSSGVVPVGVWPRRTDNVVIRTGHTITINATDDNKSCGISPDGLGRANVSSVGSPFAGSNLPMFYQTGDIQIKGTLSVTGIEMMTEGYTKILSGGAFTLTSSYVNLGFLEADAGSTLSAGDDFILAGNSSTIINTTSISNDDLIISFTDATLCGTGTTTLQLGSASTITYANGATVAQICTTFTVACTGVGCSGFPVVGTTTVLLGNVGPGGVGNSTNNKLWLRADDLTQANSTSVTSWADASGNVLTATNAVGSGSFPTFLTNSVNTILPSISFDGGDWLTLGTPASLDLIPQTNSWSFFAAFNVATNGFGTLFSKATATAGTRQYQYTVDSSNPNRFAAFMGGTFTNTGSPTATGSWIVGTGLTGASATGYNTFLNETADLSAAGVGTGTVTTTDVLVGARRVDAITTTSGFNLTGSIGEIALYNALVNTAQRIIIDNYLSAKYVTTLGANDLYTMDNAGNGNFDFEVAGIGQAADGTKHTDAKGSGMVRMWNPNGLGNSEFLIWGRDNSSATSSTTAVGTAVDGTVIKERLTRIWRVSESGGDVGTVSISFDFSGLGGSPLGSNMRLLIDRNGINGFADNDVTPVVGSSSGSIIVFSGINFQDGDRFTLGNSSLSTPLPVELISFNAKAQDKSVLLTWSTATEINNKDFTIERSLNSKDWSSIGSVNGAGNSTVRIDYRFTDEKPNQGISYYRLKQTDFDGAYKYSSVVSVDREKIDQLYAYPNPSTNSFTLVSDVEILPAQVRFINMLGITMPISITKKETETIVDPGDISAGIYFIQVASALGIKSIRVVRK